MIMRVEGRFANCNLSYSKKFPIVLPQKHVFTLSLIRFMHNTNSHAGPKVLAVFITKILGYKFNQNL